VKTVPVAISAIAIAVALAGCGSAGASRGPSSPPAAASSPAPAATGQVAQCAGFVPLDQEITGITQSKSGTVLAQTLSLYASMWANELDSVAGPPGDATQASVDMTEAAQELAFANLDLSEGASIAASWAAAVMALRDAAAECAV
jgi:hypothetical protein